MLDCLGLFNVQQTDKDHILLGTKGKSILADLVLLVNHSIRPCCRGSQVKNSEHFFPQ